MRRWLIGIAILVLAVVASGLYVAGIGTFRYVRSVMDPPNPGGTDPVRVLIPPGVNTAEVAGQLYRRGLIKEPLAFRYYARRHGLDARIRSGEYDLTPAMSVPEILGRLIRGETVSRRYTVPEGLTVDEIAEHLEQLGLVPAERFLAAARRGADAVAGWVPPDVPVRHRVEGFLFPDTYVYTGQITAEEVVAQMMRRSAAFWEQPDLERRAQELGLTVHQVVTLASIIEAEARVAAEMPRISGVFHNRLALSMKLDADPTVRFAVAKPRREPLLLTDLEVEDPYNTYRHAGLPPGPIGNPGEGAIRAALWPESHQFVYFVARGDGSGEHAFSVTYEQHLQAVAEAERMAAASY